MIIFSSTGVVDLSSEPLKNELITSSNSEALDDTATAVPAVKGTIDSFFKPKNGGGGEEGEKEDKIVRWVS